MRRGDEPRPILLASDAAYAMPLATTLRSLVESDRGGWPHDVHVLCDGFSDAERDRVVASLPRGAATVRWVPADLRAYAHLASPEFPSKMVCARLLIPQVFTESVSRVLYLDCDILVLSSLAPLWEVELDGAVLGAVLDGLDPQLKERRPHLAAVPAVRSYFNSGVLVVDLQRWRQERVSERAMRYLADHPTAPFPDQDALNVACDGAWKRLDERWNFQVMKYRDRGLRETRVSSIDPERRPAIVHFVTGQKPWKPSSGSPNAALYDAFRSRTRFGRTPGERLSDALRGGWSRAKRAGRRHPRLRAIWRLLTARDRGGARAT